MTPESFQRVVRLERIFMPYAQQQRRETYIRQTGSDPAPGAIIRFAHYTSASAAMSIIGEKRIWMRNTRCMSDYSEVQHGFTMLQEFFANNNPDRQRLFDALNACSSGVAEEAIKLFDDWLMDTNLNTYITSISEHDSSEDLHGRLSMWRAFGGNAARVAFIFNIPYGSDVLEAIPIMFSPVAYLSKEKVHGVIREVIDNINKETDFLKIVERPIIVTMIFNMFLGATVCLKHEGFHEEREWRVIYSPKRLPSPLVKNILRDVAGVPQPIYLLPLDQSMSPGLADLDLARMFDRLIIGPSPYPWPMYEAFTAALSAAGVKDAVNKVFMSGIPIRS